MINFALLIDWDFFLGKARPYDTLDQSDQYRFDLGVDWLDLGFDQSKSWCYRRHSQLGPQRPPLHCRLVVQVFRHFFIKWCTQCQENTRVKTNPPQTSSFQETAYGEPLRKLQQPVWISAACTSTGLPSAIVSTAPTPDVPSTVTAPSSKG